METSKSRLERDNGSVSLVEPLTVNQPLEVETTGTPEGTFTSTVVAIDAAKLVITMPTRRRKRLSLLPGAHLTVHYKGRVSKYGFQTTVRELDQDRVVVEPPATVRIASRRSPRIPLLDAPVQVRRTEQRGTDVTGRGMDISMRGMRLALPVALELREQVRITVPLPDGPLPVHGEVVRVEAAGTEVVHGIHFTKLSAKDTARLRKLLT